MLPYNDLINEPAYPIARSASPMALIGNIALDAGAAHDGWNMRQSYCRLKYTETGKACGNEVIPSLIRRKDGTAADYGFAARPWMIATFQWSSKNAPQPHLNRLLGLLPGYSPAAIAAMEESETGRLFPYRVSETCEPVSNALPVSAVPVERQRPLGERQPGMLQPRSGADAEIPAAAPAVERHRLAIDALANPVAVAVRTTNSIRPAARAEPCLGVDCVAEVGQETPKLPPPGVVR